MEINFDRYIERLEMAKLTRDIGKVTDVRGFLIRGTIPGVCLGSICEVYSTFGNEKFLTEVVGFEGNTTLLMPLGEIRGVGHGSKIILDKIRPRVSVGKALIGRVINGLGEPLDGKGPIITTEDSELVREAINPMKRPPICEPMGLGIKSIDGLLTLGKGQRVGILAGSGVGKSVLLGMMAKSAESDINVIALIGERGREVREFIEMNLGEEGLKKSIVIVATSDQSPLLRLRGALYATVVAEQFAQEGKNVLLMMDSVTRFAMAQREIGLNVGEPPASKGYTPSVFSLLPKLFERAGRFESGGSVTGLYTVLVEGDDLDDPIADSVRSIVDGHIVLDRNLANKGHFPAIDILKSASRTMVNVTSQEHQHMAKVIRQCIATYRENEDLISIGAYKEGSNEALDRAVHLNKMINNFMRQEVNQKVDFAEITELMRCVVEGGM